MNLCFKTILGITAAACLTATAASPVRLVRTPNEGIQPQAVVDSAGTVHLVYFKGDARGGDLFYTRQLAGHDEFSAPIQVNSQPGSSMAVGTIRGAQIALGRQGRVHVAWNGAKPSDRHAGVGMIYTRLNDAGTTFEPERDLVTFAIGLDGGGTVAADAEGRVYVLWHGFGSGKAEDETTRAVFVARSTDDGKTFAPERRANPDPTGACGCCGMRAFADSSGSLFALYRAAGARLNRDETLLVSRDHGDTFTVGTRDPWKIASCPMSSASISEAPGTVLAAWETAGQVYFQKVGTKANTNVAPPGTGKRKQPSVIGNAAGQTLLAWTEGTAWQKGGEVAWQVFDASGSPTAEKGRAPGVPVWGLVATVARPDGSFVIFY